MPVCIVSLLQYFLVKRLTCLKTLSLEVINPLAPNSKEQEQTRQNNKKTKKFFYCGFHQIDLVKLNEAAPQWISIPEKHQQLKCPLLPI